MSRPRAVFTADSPTNPATPTAVRRVSGTRKIGLGGIGDFNAIISGDSSAATAWNQIQTQLNAENAAGMVPAGVYGTLVNGAKQDFADAYAGLQQAGADVTQIVGAAQQYAVQARSVLGAATNVINFAEAAAAPGGMPPQALISSYTGILVGVLVASSAVSAGAGAAIVGAVALGTQALQGLGFFPPAGSRNLGPGCDQGQSVSGSSDQIIIIGCVTGEYDRPENTMIPGPQDNRWRTFPTDPGWFQVVPGFPGMGFINWGGGRWGSFTNGPRMIDAAFPQFRHMECEANENYAYPNQPQAAVDFEKAYFAAWKLNAALLLNGQKAADDVSVLRHLVSTWNLAHASSGNDFTFTPATSYMPSPGVGGDPVRNCADVIHQFGPYVGYLASAYGAPVTIHTGALKKPPVTMALTNNVTSTTSTTRKLAAGLVWGSVIALGGTVAYSLATRTPVTVVWQRAFDDVARFVRKPLKAIKL